MKNEIINKQFVSKKYGSYMPPDEFIKYNTRPKEMCTIIRKENGL